MESTQSWEAMIHALAGEQPHRGRVLRLEASGPGSEKAITRYVRSAIEQRAMPKAETSIEQLAEIITTTVLNRLGAKIPSHDDGRGEASSGPA
jgi:hypothetical protein